MIDNQQGSLVCVGLGICVGNHTSISAKYHIENADVVFIAAANDLAQVWVHGLNNNVVNLGELYEEGKSRLITYQQMVEVMCSAVYQGKRVCGAFYGHPGVFAYAGHQAIKQLKGQGYSATMEPGISAEDCLIADLGLDPGDFGCMALETSQFLFYQHKINPYSILLLWQVGLAGDCRFSTQKTTNNHHGLAILTEELLSYYPPKHEVILYEASMMAVAPPRIERMPLDQLPWCKPSMISTLVIPSLGLPPYDQVVLKKLAITEKVLIANLSGDLSPPTDKSDSEQ